MVGAAGCLLIDWVGRLHSVDAIGWVPVVHPVCGFVCGSGELSG
jgi:hypothetical protein